MRNLGIVGLKSIYGGYLQGDSGGTVHASNAHRNEEETWYLYEIDKAAHHYAFAVWKYGKFLCKDGTANVNCAVANRAVAAQWETWILVPGVAYGLPGRVALRSFDGRYLATNKPSDNYPGCGGEAYVSPATPPRDGGWAGWWFIEGVTSTPTPGFTPWTAIGGAVQGVLNVFASAAIDTLVADLLLP